MSTTTRQSSGGNQDAGNPPAPVDDGRVRFLRACDRCRVRKIKCGNENPCGRCVAAKVVCSFSAGSTTRAILSTTEPNRREVPPSDSDDTSPLPGPSRVRQRASSELESNADSETQRPRKRPVLDSFKTSHFFLSSQGLSHYAGSTSGLPLLEATQRLAHDGIGEAARSKRTEPDWEWLQELLGDGPPPARDGHEEFETPEDEEYFPGRDVAPSQADDDLISSIAVTIPPDLMASLLAIFFSVVHPVWPILHKPSFLARFERINDYSFAALVVSMCMLASRYTDDPRVRSDPENPATAGLDYVELFNRLLDKAVRSDHVIHAIQSRFFASMFHCVDNIPHPVAQGLFAEALSRMFDGGLHRPVPPLVLPNPILREIRSRTAWAMYAWDKQISAFCGRPHLMSLWDIDVRLPEPFEDGDEFGKDEPPEDTDHSYVTTFRQLALVSAVLEMAFRASSDAPVVANSPFLSELSRQCRPYFDDAEALGNAIRALTRWRSEAPPVLTESQTKTRAACLCYSVSTEQVTSIDQMVQLLVAARYLQLETLSPEPRKDVLVEHRAALIFAARNMVSIAVQLGSVHQLGKCDILIAYRLLLTGRLLLACVLSARSDKNTAQTQEATKVLNATSVVLRHFVALFPVALGAAEVLDETIRVCRVPSQPRPAHGATASRYAWYRPLAHQTTANTSSAMGRGEVRVPTPRSMTGPSQPFASSSSQPGNGANAGIPDGSVPLDALAGGDFSPFDTAFSAIGNVAMPLSLFGDTTAHSSETDFMWLLPNGGDSSLPYLVPPFSSDDLT